MFAVCLTFQQVTRDESYIIFPQKAVAVLVTLEQTVPFRAPQTVKRGDAMSIRGIAYDVYLDTRDRSVIKVCSIMIQ